MICLMIKFLWKQPVMAFMKRTKLKNVKTIAAGGGVVANGYLREKLKAECEKRNIKLYLPERGLCTDNAAMIGAEGYIRYLNGDFADMTLNAEAQVEL